MTERENKVTCGVVLFIYFYTQVMLLAAPQEFSHVQGCENHVLMITAMGNAVLKSHIFALDEKWRFWMF